MKRISVVLLTLSFGCAPSAWSNVPSSLPTKLEDIRGKIVSLQEGLLNGLQEQKQAKSNVKKIQTLLKLQKQEKVLGEARLAELEKMVQSLQSRRKVLGEKVGEQSRDLHRLLSVLDRALNSDDYDQEDPRRKLMANLVDRSLKDLEAFRVDLTDSDHLETRIEEEKQQVAYLVHDLNEQESVLELNRQIQEDVFAKKHAERVSQLENYRKLKSSEAQVEVLMGQFNARLELERSTELERETNRELATSDFAKSKGHLGLPVSGGKILSEFGRNYDERSRLYVFKKGVDISGLGGQKVQAVFGGKVAYSGELPDYGKVTIIDHGAHFYSLCAHLGELTKKTGEIVATGDAIGLTDTAGTPIYFEIRARNVAVNPLQWFPN